MIEIGYGGFLRLSKHKRIVCFCYKPYAWKSDPILIQRSRTVASGSGLCAAK